MVVPVFMFDLFLLVDRSEDKTFDSHSAVESVAFEVFLLDHEV